MFTKRAGLEALEALDVIYGKLSATAKTAVAGPLRELREFIAAAAEAAPSDADVRRARWKEDAKAAERFRARRKRKGASPPPADDSPTLFEAPELPGEPKPE